MAAVALTVVFSSDVARQEFKEDDTIFGTKQTDIEEPPENIIQKDLQSLLKPLNIIQTIFFDAKYKIRDKIIVINSTCYNIILIIATLILRIGFHTILGKFTIDKYGF